MKLTGFAFSVEGDPFDSRLGHPLRRGYLPLDALTAVIGPNDSGKSSLLRLVTASLMPDGAPARGMFFAQCTPEEFAELTAHAISDLQELSEPPRTLEREPLPGQRGTWWYEDEYESDDPAMPVIDESEPLDASHDALGQWAQRLCAGVPDRLSWAVVLAASTSAARASLGELGDGEPRLERPTIGLEPVASEEEPIFNLFWCLPAYSELPTEVRAALSDCGLKRAESDPEIWDGRWATGQPRHLYPPDNHRRLVAAPIVVAPLGRTVLPIAPEPMTFPIGFARAREELEQAVGSLVSSTRWTERLLDLGSDGLFEDLGNGPVMQSAAPSEPDDAWVETLPSGWRLHPDVAMACELIVASWQELVPPQVAGRYRLLVDVRPPTDWGDGGRLDVRLQARAARTEGEGAFALDTAAEGYHLWIELGLAEIAGRLRSEAHPIRQWTTLLEDSLAGDDEELLEVPLEELNEKCREQLSAFRARETLEVRPQTPGLAASIPAGPYPAGLVDQVALGRGRFYVIDEPERHLHPRLQREAARWLAEVLPRHTAQALIASHSMPFLSLSGSVSYSYLVREDISHSALVPISPGELTALDGAAEELGFDRGELLALVEVVLWVEGPMDQAVLENLFPTELKAAGIAVAPLHGYYSAKGILDAALLRFTTATPAVWLDKISDAYVRELLASPDAAKEACKSEKDERRVLAQLVMAAHEHGRDVVPIGTPDAADDVFDLLDEDVIKDLFPGFPGHAEAEARWEKAVAAGKKVSERKQFWDQKFKTPVNPETCAQIAREMRERGKRPQGLLSVLDQCKAARPGPAPVD